MVFATAGNSVECHAKDLLHKVKNLIDKRVGGCGGNIVRAQCRQSVCPGNVVEVGEVGNQKLPQADELADQVAAAHSGRRSEPAGLSLGQSLCNRTSGGGDGAANKMLDGTGGWGFGCGGRGRKDVDSSWRRIHGRARKMADVRRDELNRSAGWRARGTKNERTWEAARLWRSQQSKRC